MFEETIEEYWSEDKRFYSKICKSDKVYPGMYKLIMNEDDGAHQCFKFFKILEDAQIEAEDYVLRKT